MRETPTFCEVEPPDEPPDGAPLEDEQAARASDPATMPTVTTVARDVIRCPIAPRTIFMTFRRRCIVGGRSGGCLLICGRLDFLVNAGEVRRLVTVLYLQRHDGAH